MASYTEDMPRSAWSAALETCHGAPTIIRRILDWLLWITDVLDLLAQPHKIQEMIIFISEFISGLYMMSVDQSNQCQIVERLLNVKLEPVLRYPTYHFQNETSFFPSL
jgi:hypothetical protein